MTWLQRLSLIFLVGFLVSGCSRLSVSDLATTAGAGVGAVAGAATGLGPVVTVTSTLAGGAAGGALVGETVTTAEACVENPEVCTQITVAKTVQDFIHWIIGGGVLLIIAAWLIPGPQSLWRKKDGKSDRTANGTRPGRRR